MFDFQKAVDKAERRTLKVQDGSLPYIEVSRKYGFQFLRAAAGITFAWLIFAFIVYIISNDLSFGTLALFALCWVASYVWLIDYVYRGYRTKAIYQRTELRLKRGDMDALKKHEEQALIAAQEHQRQAEHQRAVDFNRTLYQMRLSLRRDAEAGVREAVRLYREQAIEEQADTVWEPEGVNAKRIYAEVREDMKAAKIPEHGLLRDTTDGMVGMVLGRDRSWLPPDMTDEQIVARHLPKPVEPIPAAPTLKLTAKRKR